jgi:MFS family permease
VLRELLLISAMALYIVANSWIFLIVGVAIIGLSYAVEPVWSTFVAESSPQGGLGMAYGVVNAAFMAAGVFAPVTAGLLAASFGYTSVYWLVGVLGLLTVAVILVKLPESNNKEGKVAVTLHKLAKAFEEVVRPPREMWGFYLSMAVDGIAFGLGTRLLYGMLTRSQGYTPYMLSLMATSLTVAWAVVQIPFGRLVDRLGYRRSLAISQTLSCLYLAGMLTAQRFEIVLALQALIGIAAALWVPAEQAWIASNVEPKRRGEYLGSYLAFRGLVAFPAPFVGGVLYDTFGFSAPLTVNLIGAIVDTILIAALVKDKLRSTIPIPS